MKASAICDHVVPNLSIMTSIHIKDICQQIERLKHNKILYSETSSSGHFLTTLAQNSLSLNSLMCMYVRACVRMCVFCH